MMLRALPPTAADRVSKQYCKCWIRVIALAYHVTGWNQLNALWAMLDSDFEGLAKWVKKKYLLLRWSFDWITAMLFHIVN